MTDEIRVSVCKYPDRENLVLRYIDPLTGKQKTKSAGTSDEAEAIGKAAVWQDELTTGRYQAPSRLTWAEFRKRYEAEKLAGLAHQTQQNGRGAMNHLERVVNPGRLCTVTTDALSRFQADLRAEGMKPVTIASVLRHLRPALTWAVSMKMLAQRPDIHPPRRVKGQALMRGRPITEEEFDRLLLAIPKVRPDDAPDWERLLRGLWLSGLRLGEALVLSWDQDEPFKVDLSGKLPAIRIYAEAQKSHRDEILPITPDFAQWLLQTPEADRHGLVFKLGGSKPMTVKWAGMLISDIGRRAGVVVNKADGKNASAHDLRRTFGTRWAKRVMPAVLRRLMRHASIDTTMAYYVDLDAGEVAAELWRQWPATDGPAVGNISGNIRKKSALNASNSR